jgi:hypothetical protein
LIVTELAARLGAWVSMLLPALIMLGFWGLLIGHRIRKRLREMKRHEDAGTIGRASFFQGGDMPVHYNLVAQVGTGGPAATSLGEKILRPSIGVRLVVLVVVGMIFYYTTQPAFWPSGFNGPDQSTEQIFNIARVLLPIAGLYGVIYIFTSEARYDRDVLIVTRYMLFRREYRWKALTRVSDGGAYDLVLTFKPGGKAKVLKHSAGIRDFKVFALAQVQKNRAAYA